MKSQVYRQVSYQPKSRKSTTKNKIKKQAISASHVNPIRMSKGLRSQTRSLIKSIDLNNKLKRSTNENMLRMSFSRPPVQQILDEIQIPHVNEKSIVSVCCRCENLQLEHEKQMKLMKMQRQEEIIANNQKFIAMQKKYLMKQSQYIQLQNNFNQKMKENHELNHYIYTYKQQIDELNVKIDQSDAQILKLYEELKRQNEQNRFFNHFLTAFVEQTKSMVQWCQLFDNSYEELPSAINTVRKDLMNRRVDLDVILKQSVNYQIHNFGVSSVKASHNNSFFDSEEDGSQSFMKYLKQNTISTKQKASRSIYDFSQAFTVNKQNIDNSNKHNFQSLIHSRLHQQMDRQRSQIMKDQFMRMLLTQAQSIENGCQSRSLGNSKNHFSGDNSLLSSISKKIDHYVQ